MFLLHGKQVLIAQLAQLAQFMFHTSEKVESWPFLTGANTVILSVYLSRRLFLGLAAQMSLIISDNRVRPYYPKVPFYLWLLKKLITQLMTYGCKIYDSNTEVSDISPSSDSNKGLMSKTSVSPSPPYSVAFWWQYHEKVAKALLQSND